MTTTNAAPRQEPPLKSRAIAALAAAPLVLLATSGCSLPDPCARLAPPTAQELAVVAGGAEVERTVDLPGAGRGRASCDLIDGRWTRETT